MIMILLENFLFLSKSKIHFHNEIRYVNLQHGYIVTILSFRKNIKFVFNNKFYFLTRKNKLNPPQYKSLTNLKKAFTRRYGVEQDV